MIKKRTIWEASNGVMFDAEETALEYEIKYELLEKKHKFWEFLTKKVTTKNSHTWPGECADYIYDHAEEVFEFIRRLKEDER